MGLSVVILAAGRGKRMLSSLPKVLHPLGGMPMLEHVVRTAEKINADAIHVVYGNGGQQVRDRLHDLPVNWVKQDEQLGTGHAVLQAMPLCDDTDQILVLYGDVPLISTKTLNKLIKQTAKNAVGLVVTELQNPQGFGRIVRNELGNIVAIVEEKDATAFEKKIREINTGIMTTSANNFKKWLPALKNDNRQQEFYLTDVVSMAVENGVSVGGVFAACSQEVRGVNDHWQQATLERYYQLQQARTLTEAGVTVIDPHRIEVRGDVRVEHDVTIDVNVILEGQVTIGAHVHIGPNVILKNVDIGDHVFIKSNSVITDTKIASHCVVGPFAHLRPGTELAEGAKVGNFVETKNTKLGICSKANHLTYLGDAHIGKNVNIGAGTITCNYDGVNKFKTKIGDAAFIGSNTALVAPIHIGRGATIGAGSTITRKAPADKLTLTRAKQATIEAWVRPQKSDT